MGRIKFIDIGVVIGFRFYVLVFVIVSGFINGFVWLIEIGF